MKLRDNFPPFGSQALGGNSNGLVYTTAFAGSSMAASLVMVRQFLDEEGYADVPIPRSAEEMLSFLQPEQGRHPHLFERPDYAHNPVRLVLPPRDRLRRKLIVELYNESAPEHLLRFHRRLDPKREATLVDALRSEHLEHYGSLLLNEAFVEPELPLAI